MVRFVLELTVRKNLHFFDQCRYYLLLFTELCMNTSNHNQFDTYKFMHIQRIVTCQLYSYVMIVLDF